MIRILVESDHFLKILPVMLDPKTPVEHARAVADFFAHDVPDFLGWCDDFRAQVPGLYPAGIEFAEDERELVAKSAGADAIIVESLALRSGAIAQMKPAAIVHKFGAITTNIDMDACAKRRVTVLTQPREGNVAVAEQVFALMIALAKRVCELNGKVTAEQLLGLGYSAKAYDRRYTGGSNYGRIPGLRVMAGATLGIVGLGEIGAEVASRAAAFGMSILYHQRNRLSPRSEMALGARYVSLEELMANSDYIVIQLPLNDSTRGMIGRKELAAAKPGAFLINCARAALTDRDAIVDALDSGKLAGLGMDVGYSEPWTADDPLLNYKKGNVVLMPHTAVAARQHGLADLANICRNIWRTLENRRIGRKHG